MRAKTLTAVCSLALSFLLVLPSVALGQQRTEDLVRQINDALAANPTSTGTFSIAIDGSGKLVAEQRDGAGVLSRWEMYFEDVASFSLTDSGQLYLNCNEELGRCVRVVCNGVVANFSGCMRGSAEGRKTGYADALELGYQYDTRARRALEEAFDGLMALGQSR